MKEVLTHIRRLGALVAIAALVTTVLAPSPAYADGRYRWQNEYNGNWLEIWLSNRDNGGRVITYPWQGGNNQLWADYHLSDGYYRLMNVNSGRFLGHVDQPYSASPGACGYPDQYEWLGTAYQWWSFRILWDSWPEVRHNFVGWANLAGCQGNPYHDMLSVADSFNTTLYTEDFCTDLRNFDPTSCYWKRDGRYED